MVPSPPLIPLSEGPWLAEARAEMASVSRTAETDRPWKGLGSSVARSALTMRMAFCLIWSQYDVWNWGWSLAIDLYVWMVAVGETVVQSRDGQDR